MGFDLYGLKPYNPNNAVRPEHLDWSKKPADNEKDEYFKKVDEYETEVIGSYFRNNVWWWRPLWSFVIAACDDILTERDKEAGSYNDGHIISKTKSLRIAARLTKLDKDGTIDKYSNEMNPMIERAKKNNKKIQIKVILLQKMVKLETGVENMVPKDYPKKFYDKYMKLMDKEDWSAHYPFDIDNIRSFTLFCKQSGGFEIC